MRIDPKTMIAALRQAIKRVHYPAEIMRVSVRWYVAYPLSPRHLEEIMADSGLPIELRQLKYLNNVIEQDHRAAAVSRVIAAKV